MTEKTQVQKRDKGIKELLTSDAFRTQVQNALPKHLKPERFIRIALTALTKTPNLMQCTQESFFQSLLTLSQLGLEPDGRLAHLIPYGDSCTVIVDYKGLCDLAMRSGKVSNIHADIVCENDVFEYDKGEVRTHKIDFKKPRGAMYAVYAICRFKDGTEASAVMTKDEVEAIRARSKAGKSGPWVTDWNEMAKKTAFRRLSKWLPLSPEYRDALEQDHDQFEPINITPEREDIEMPKRLSEQAEDTPERKERETTAEDEPECAEGEEPFEDDAPEDKPEQPNDIPEGAVKLQGVIAKITKKPGKKKTGEPFTRYGVLLTDTDNGDQWVNTFNKTDGEEAEKLEGALVDVIAMETRFGYDLIEIKPAIVDGDAKEQDNE